MQDDHARPPAQLLDDPPVALGVVADVVERDVRAPRGARRAGAAADDVDLEPLLAARAAAARCSRRSPDRSGRQRRVVRDLHAQQPLDHAVPGTQLGERLPGLPPRPRLVDVSRQPRARLGERAGARLADEPGLRGRARPRAARPRRSSSRPASPTGTPRRDEAEVLVDRRVVDGAGSAHRGRSAPPRTRGRRNARGRRGPSSRASCSSRSRSGPSPAITTRSEGRPASASSSRSTRFARSRRPTERTKSLVLVAAVGSSCGGGSSTSASSPVERSQPAGDVLRDREELARLAERDAGRAGAPRGAARGPQATRRTGRARFRRARTPAGTGARARRPCSDAGRRTTGTSSRSRGRSGGRRPPRGRAAARGTPASARARPGYHLKGTVTSSASWPRSRSSSTRRSLRISAPPRTNGTWAQADRDPHVRATIA